MKPEIPCTGLSQADPFVLAVIASHLDHQSILGANLQRLRLARWRTVAATATPGSQQILQLHFQLTQLSVAIVGIVPVRLNQVCKKAFAAFNQRKALVMVDQSLFNQRNGAPQSFGALVELLGPVNAVFIGRGLTENGISLVLQVISATGGLQSLDLLESLSLLPLSALFQKLLQILTRPQQLLLVEMVPLIQTQTKTE